MGGMGNWGFTSDLTRNFMWQAPNQRMRAQANSRNASRDRGRQAIHIKRVAITVTLQAPGAEP